MPPETLEESIPLVDLDPHLNGKCIKDAAAVLTESMEQFGAVLIRDPRVSAADSDAFVDLMERYFEQSREAKLADARPEYYHQVGATPDHTERPRDNSGIAASLAPEHRPRSNPGARNKDPKWRFFWRVGSRPEQTEYPQLNAPQVIPKAFENEWEDVMNAWGTKLLDTSRSAAQLLAVGLGLPSDAITTLMEGGAHLLAPTGTNLEQYGSQVGCTLAGYHYDISLLSLHGRARYPGLFIWTRDGRRIPVVMPHGTLLVQSGIQLEHLTAGRIMRGMHEVVVSEQTAAAALDTSKRSKWRVSSTLFAHVHSDRSLAPLITNGGVENKYTGMKAGELVAAELKELELAVEH